MTPEFDRILDSKRAFRKKLAAKPVAEKLRILEQLAERTLATRRDTSSPLPEAPWSIPAHWRWAKMGDVAQIVGGGTPSTGQSEYFGGEIPWITPADLSGHQEKMITRGARSITAIGLQNSGARLMPAGTVLFSSRAPIGYIAIAANPVATNQGFKSFVLDNELLPDYVYYYLLRAKEFAIALASGTTFLEISGKNAARLPIPIPPLEEQRQIVSEIEKQFTRLEAGVRALRRVQANLKRYRATVLKAACEGRLVPTEAELAETRDQEAKFQTGEDLLLQILVERRKNSGAHKKYKEPTTPSAGNFPPAANGWAIASIDQLVDETMIGLDRGRAQQGNDRNSGVPYIKMSNVSMDGKVSYKQLVYVPVTEGEAERFAVRNGDIIFNTRNSKELVGKVGLVRNPPPGAIYNNNLMRIRVVAKVLPAFLALQMCSHDFRRRMELVKKATTNVAAVYLKDLLSMAIALPPLAEQTRIVDEVERRLSVIEEIQAVVTGNLQRATRLHESILQKAFTGNIT